MITIKEFKKLTILLGYRGLVSHKTLYGDYAGTFSYKGSSAYALSINTKDSLVQSVYVNTTYFEQKPNVRILNDWLQTNGARTISECIEYLSQLEKTQNL